MAVTVPDDAEHYVVETIRGDVAFSHDELEANSWTAEVSVGD